MSQCKIYLDSLTYQTGTLLKGKVECIFEESTKVRGVKVRITCQGNTERSNHSAFDRVFDVTKLLFDATAKPQVMEKGKYVYPFSLTLDKDLPSSFKGSHGEITYRVKGIVDRPLRFDYKDTVILEVVSPIDLNTFPKAFGEKTSLFKEKTICCLCCKRGRISMDLVLQKRGYIPGDVVDFTVAVKNMSSIDMECLRISLKKRITYALESQKVSDVISENEVVHLKESGVDRGRDRNYKLQFKIPEDLEVLNFSRSRLFKVQYPFCVTGVLTGCTLNLKLHTNFIIGNIPINLEHQQWTGRSKY